MFDKCFFDEAKLIKSWFREAGMSQVGNKPISDAPRYYELRSKVDKILTSRSRNVARRKSICNAPRCYELRNKVLVASYATGY